MWWGFMASPRITPDDFGFDPKLQEAAQEEIEDLHLPSGEKNIFQSVTSESLISNRQTIIKELLDQVEISGKQVIIKKPMIHRDHYTPHKNCITSCLTPE